MVYVEQCIIPWRGKLWAHLMADTTEELNNMADKIGLKRSWLQKAGTDKEHYDVVESIRIKALKYGALSVKSALRAKIENKKK